MTAMKYLTHDERLAKTNNLVAMFEKVVPKAVAEIKAELAAKSSVFLYGTYENIVRDVAKTGGPKTDDDKKLVMISTLILQTLLERNDEVTKVMHMAYEENVKAKNEQLSNQAQ